MYSFATKSRNRLVTLVVLVGIALGAPACSSQPEKKDEPPTSTTPTQPQELSAPPYVGTLKSAPISGLGFQQAVLKIDVKSDFTATGVFEGGYDDRYFEVPMDGTVDRMDGSIELSGKVASHDIVVRGDLTKSGFQGEIVGEVSTDDVDLPMSAEPAEPELDDSDEDVEAVEME